MPCRPDQRPASRPTVAASASTPAADLPWLGTLASRDGFRLRLIEPAADAPWLHDWLRQDYARFWGLNQASVTEVLRVYQRIQTSPYCHAYLGCQGEQPAFLLEHYLPLHDEVGQHYSVHEGDHGIHFALAPVQTPRHGFSLEVLLGILEIIFRDTPARRVVVEPDIRNHKIHTLNFRAGFYYCGLLELASKSAFLGFCNRRQFARAQYRYRHPQP
ncbi:GNAT family N-acetyltransferase [Frateuria aurantia]